jgi:hypothetical protein
MAPVAVSRRPVITTARIGASQVSQSEAPLAALKNPRLIPVRFRAVIHAIWRSLLAGDGYELNHLQAGSSLPAD